MPYPTPIVEIAFTDGPYVVSPTWTDVTAYVREMQITRGTSDDWNLVADGSANIVLSNRDRRFDPFNASGPYFGNLLPRRQIRIRATSGGTTYDVFRGFIAGWPPEWTDAGYDSTVTLSCFDALQLLGSSSLPADWSRDYILSLGPRHYYPLDEPVSPGTSITARDLGSNPQPLPIANAAPAYELAQGLASSAMEISASSVTSAGSFSLDFTVSAWMNYTNGVLFFVGRFSVTMYFDQADDKYTVALGDGNTSTQYLIKTTSTFTPGEPFMLTFTFNQGTFVNQVFLNGIQQTTTVTTSAVLVPIVLEGVFLGNGVYQQLLVFIGVLTPQQILNIYNYSEALFPESSTARFNRIIGETPFPSALTSAPVSPASPLLDITNDAPTASSELAKVAESEFAPLFVSKTGVVTQYQQNQIRTQTRSIVVQAIYGGAGLPIGTDVQLQYDGDSMRNVANVEVSGGGFVIGVNTSSVNTYGEAEQLVSSQVSTLAAGGTIANIVTQWGGTVYAKASPVQVVLSPDQFWGTTLGLELWDRFALNVVPRTGAAISTPMLLTRVSHNVTPERWSTTVEGSARWAAVFILDTSRLGGTDLLG